MCHGTNLFKCCYTSVYIIYIVCVVCVRVSELGRVRVLMRGSVLVYVSA